MKFYISRYTAHSDKMQPCDEALLDEDGRWYIEIHSMQKFAELLVKYQTLISEHDPVKDEFTIEIFDDWSSQA